MTLIGVHSTIVIYLTGIIIETINFCQEKNFSNFAMSLIVYYHFDHSVKGTQYWPIDKKYRLNIYRVFRVFDHHTI